MNNNPKTNHKIFPKPISHFRLNLLVSINSLFIFRLESEHGVTHVIICHKINRQKYKETELEIVMQECDRSQETILDQSFKYKIIYLVKFQQRKTIY